MILKTKVGDVDESLLVKTKQNGTITWTLDGVSVRTESYLGGRGMTVAKFAGMSPEDQAKWLESPEHCDNCAAHSEGQWCCLEELVEAGKVG